MAKLNQILAIEKGIKSGVYAEGTQWHKLLQKPELFNGLSKQYQKLDDDGEDLPSENKRVQITVPDVLRSVERGLTQHFDVTARKDWTNCSAKGTIVVDGAIILSDVPVTYLLFLEKQLTDYKTIVSSLPTLDIADDWTTDPNSGLYKTGEVKTHRTKKLQKPLVLYPATAEHPAQTQVITEDVLVGHWVTVKQSGAIPRPKKAKLLERVEKLLQAVKQAREAANMVDEDPTPAIGSVIFNFLAKDA